MEFVVKAGKSDLFQRLIYSMFRKVGCVDV